MSLDMGILHIHKQIVGGKKPKSKQEILASFIPFSQSPKVSAAAVDCDHDTRLGVEFSTC